MMPGAYHHDALPRRSYGGRFGTIWCERCGFFGLGYNRPEWCTWQWLTESRQVGAHLVLVELGGRVAARLSPTTAGVGS